MFKFFNFKILSILVLKKKQKPGFPKVVSVKNGSLFLHLFPFALATIYFCLIYQNDAKSQISMKTHWHTTFSLCYINVDATPWHYIDVYAMLYWHCVPAGKRVRKNLVDFARFSLYTNSYNYHDSSCLKWTVCKIKIFWHCSEQILGHNHYFSWIQINNRFKEKK